MAEGHFGAQKTWKPTTAGILSIVAGGVNVLVGLIVSIVGGGIAWIGADFAVPRILGLLGIPLIVLGAVSVVGGICALSRKYWGVALAGAICALFPPFVSLFGILAIVFVAIGKEEFQ